LPGLSWGGRFVRLSPEARALPENKESTSMSSSFVWFHHNGRKANETKTFFESLLPGVHPCDGPGGMTMLATDAGPFAALGSKEDRYGDRDEWIPFVAVEDVEAALRQALALGASLLRETRRGPAGEFAVVRDPGGAALALRKKA
jgi:predicted enzyme related to lactoylglutathione lyase